MDLVTLALAKKYTKDSIEGAGAIEGKSAYEIAVEKGFAGIKEEWLESLKGEDYVITESDKTEIADMIKDDVNELKEDLIQLKNTGDNPSPAGKIWTTTDSGAGWDYPQKIVDIKPDQIYGSEPVDESGKDLDITSDRRDGFYVSTATGGDAQFNGLSVGSALIEAGKTYLVTLWNAPPNNVVGFYTTGLSGGTQGYLGKDYASAVDFDLVDQANKVYSFVAPDGAVRVNYSYWTADGGFIKEIGTKPDLYKLPWLKVYESNLSEQLKSKLNTDDVYKYGDSILKPFHFNGKLAVSFGDSITFGITSPGLVYSYSPYIKQFADHVGMSLDNKAVSGSTIAKKSGFSCVSDKIDEYNGDADFIIIAGGTNDYQLQTDLGFFGDGSTNTFYGALEHICSAIERKASNATVIFITPVNRTTYVNGQYTLNDYRNAIYEVATKHKYNVVDGSSIGFPSNIGDWANTMIDNADGVHPTTLGHYQYFKGLCEKLC